MRFLSIASGSSGNCLYVGSDTTHILVDTGISLKRTEAGLNGIGLKTSEIDAIFISHEHSDHIGGLGVIARKYGIPIYASKGTISGIKSGSYGKDIDVALFNEISADNKVMIKDICVNPMRISHDALEPLAMRLSCDGKKIGIVTDLGTYDDYTIGSLMGLNMILCEANHDIRMLETGPYPYPLKRRILSDRGHLCNEAGGKLISSILNDNIEHIILGHLSKENNMPEIAYNTVRLEIDAADNQYASNDFEITVAKRNEPLGVIEL